MESTNVLDRLHLGMSYSAIEYEFSVTECNYICVYTFYLYKIRCLNIETHITKDYVLIV